MADIPDSVVGRVELLPVEDVLLRLLRPELPEVTISTVVPASMANVLPFVVVRRQYSNMHWRGDQRSFLDQAYIQVDAFAKDPDGDEDAAILSEAVRVTLRDLWLGHRIDAETGAHISHFRLINPPRRAGDWANATGPVQYADLPAGAWRYTTVYRITLRYSK